ncbi:MAG TPA: peptide-methionine (R)-S-oxide reductase MsrB [Polyangiaceae bacterium LLY-WYZ-14_1]|nr:peptide-methionine (R)-S-oxide reductase MsrB [Polyangiaceae bacterium LLY-WYZ-14_1]
MKRRSIVLVCLAVCLGTACSKPPGGGETPASEPSSGGWPGPEEPRSFVDANPPPIGEELTLSESEWRQRLTREEFRILREEGTERPFTSPLLEEHRTGTFHCAGCGAPLYPSRAKFDSGTGWPSFTQPVAEGRITKKRDASLGMVRVEVECARCGGHLGHVFDDGPPPTGKRHCINGVALDFQPDPSSGDEGSGAHGPAEARSAYR